MVGVVGLMGNGRRLADMEGFIENVLLYAGIGLLAVGIVLVVWVVRPRTRPDKVKQEAAEGYIYFGHLNFRSTSDVEQALKYQDILPVLSRQLVEMSRIAWNKHRLLKWSITAASGAVILLLIAAGLNG